MSVVSALNNAYNAAKASGTNTPTQASTAVNNAVASANAFLSANKGSTPSSPTNTVINTAINTATKQAGGNYTPAIVQQPQQQQTTDQRWAEYLDRMEKLLNNQPNRTPKTAAEIEEQAKNYVNLQIDPQLQSLVTMLERAKQNSEAQKASINTAYSTVGDRSSRLMQEAQEEALKSAIARGMSRSGAVEAGTAKLQAPVLERTQQLDAEQTAALNDVIAKLALAEQQYGDQVNTLNTNKGAMTTQYIQQLTDLDQANQTNNWAKALEVMNSMAALAANKSASDTTAALQGLAYTMPTYGQEEDIRSNIASVLGSIPTTTNTLTQAVNSPLAPLRAYANSVNNGSAVEYKVDPTGAKYVRVGTQWFKVADNGTFGYGGTIMNNTAYMPQNVLSQLLGSGGGY